METKSTRECSYGYLNYCKNKGPSTIANGPI